MSTRGADQYFESEHIEKASHNLRFCDEINSSDGKYCDWQVTALFYTALHLIQGYFASLGNEYPADHRERRRCIREDRQIRRIRHQYEDLKNSAETARYKCVELNAEDVELARTQLQEISDHLANSY